MDTYREILLDASNLTQAVGRRIGSVKNNPNDIDLLISALESIQNTLKVAKDLMIDSYQKDKGCA